MKRLNLKCFRTKQGLKQEEMALKLGISRQAYMNIESGKTNPSYNLMLKFSKVFENEYTDIWELFKKE